MLLIQPGQVGSNSWPAGLLFATADNVINYRGELCMCVQSESATAACRVTAHYVVRWQLPWMQIKNNCLIGRAGRARFRMQIRRRPEHNYFESRAGN